MPRVSNISVRLVPPYRGVDFFGRVEVQYNNTWGTVCDDLVRLTEANVICQALNFERALCYLPRARYGPGSGIYVHYYLAGARYRPGSGICALLLRRG